MSENKDITPNADSEQRSISPHAHKEALKAAEDVDGRIAEIVRLRGELRGAGERETKWLQQYEALCAAVGLSPAPGDGRQNAPAAPGATQTGAPVPAHPETRGGAGSGGLGDAGEVACSVCGVARIRVTPAPGARGFENICRACGARRTGRATGEPACDIKVEMDALRERAERAVMWARAVGVVGSDLQALYNESETYWAKCVAYLERVNRELTEAAARNDAAHKRVCEELAALRNGQT